MTEEKTRRASDHLSDAELFSAALPAGGRPEALPAHLSECLACSRAMAEWKNAIRELASEDAAPIAERGPAQWTAAEDRTIALLRRSRPKRPRMPLRWAVAAAAVLFLVVLLLPARHSRETAPRRSSDTSELTPEDQADDALLRDVARLSRGEDGGTWNSLAPDPRSAPSGDDRL
jgi:hypothetical protein